jgi:hypothetical protein
MSRARRRACLEEGLVLNLSRLRRLGIIAAGERTFARPIRWTHQQRGEVAFGVISADLVPPGGWLEVEVEGVQERFEIVREPRHFGGYQLYFLCPVTFRKATVLWRPVGATEFQSRAGWGNAVAYMTQIGSWIDRAHHGKAKIRARLSAGAAKDSSPVPPRPPRMHRKTYRRYAEKFEMYDKALSKM